MENDVFKTNPVFQNLSPEKLSFLMNFANSKKPTEMKDMMPFLLGTLSSAKKQNIQFTKPETEPYDFDIKTEHVTGGSRKSR